jgi:ribonuclease BN (tRNA processing enzyme)
MSIIHSRRRHGARVPFLRAWHVLAAVLGTAILFPAISIEGTLHATEAQPPAGESGTRLVLLGTGTPNAEADRSGPSLAIVANGVPYIVDAGPGVVRRAAAARDAGITALDPANLAIVFLTHLHSDHTAGLPDLIFTPWTLGRAEPLHIIGPHGTRAMARHLEQAYRADVHIRLDGLEPANRTGWRVNAQDVEPGVVYEDANVRVTAFLVKHGSWKQAFGYRFDTADRSIVVSGDTVPTDAVVRACDGCDILVHEVYSQAGFEQRSPEWQRYHSAFHTSAVQLGQLAARARPKLLVLTHTLLWGSTPDELVAEVKSGFDGNVVYGQDLDVY